MHLQPTEEAQTRTPTAAAGTRTGTDTWEGPHVTDTLDSTTAAPTTDPQKKRAGGLNSLLLADLKSMAGLSLIHI